MILENKKYTAVWLFVADQLFSKCVPKEIRGTLVSDTERSRLIREYSRII